MAEEVPDEELREEEEQKEEEEKEVKVALPIFEQFSPSSACPKSRQVPPAPTVSRTPSPKVAPKPTPSPVAPPPPVPPVPKLQPEPVAQAPASQVQARNGQQKLDISRVCHVVTGATMGYQPHICILYDSMTRYNL